MCIRDRLRNALAEGLQSVALPGRASKLGTGDMRLRKQKLEAHLQHQRRRSRRGLQPGRELSRLDQIGMRN